MILRRRSEPDEAPRLAAVRATIVASAPSSPALRLLDDVGLAIRRAEADRDQLDEALRRLDSERASAELKSALRSRPSPATPDSPHITALRRRHESIASVTNRRDEITQLIDRTYADAETLAASAVAAAAVGGDHEVAAMRAMTDQIAADTAALEAAHREVAGIGGPPS